MKILIKECKKIMDIRVLLVIAVFTVFVFRSDDLSGGRADNKFPV